ncbi:C40 family peptidase [Alkalibacterium sp.]|nr:MAG: peptidoglycan endopeptidase [Alkalibacterium sp.]
MDFKKRLMIITVVSISGLAGLTVTPYHSSAAPLTEGSHSERMSSLTEKESDAEEQIGLIAEMIKETENEADKLVMKLEHTTDELEDIRTEIETVSATVTKRESKLQAQARAVQVAGQSSNILRFLMESESLSDVLGRIDVVSTLVSANQNLITIQLEDMETIQLRERDLLEKQEEQFLLAAQLENSKMTLEEQMAVQESLIASIALERSELTEERESLLAQQQERQRISEEMQSARTEAESTSSITVSSESEEENSVSLSSSESQTQTSGVVSVAHGLTGSPYSFSGTSPVGFDCSGYTQFVFQRSGRSIPRTAAAQFGASSRLSQSEARPGDLIFFNQSGSIDHVGIYLGGGRFIGSQTSTGVAVASFTSGYWSNYVAGFGRP